MHKGWFRIPGVQDGDRTLEQQLKGLDDLLREVKGCSVLDLGCAEGLIARSLLDAGARHVAGLDILPAHVDEARRQCAGRKASFGVQDLDRLELGTSDGEEGMVDIVLMLAILHKLRDPLRLVREIKEVFPRLIVIRMPAATPGYVQDRRSGNVRFDVVAELQPEYALRQVEKGHFDEWIGYFHCA